MIEHVWEDALLLLCLKHDILCSLQVSPGDTGWDVFSLDYHVDGPIATVTHTGFPKYCLSLRGMCTLRVDVLLPVLVNVFRCSPGSVWATTCGCSISYGGPSGWSTP